MNTKDDYLKISKELITKIKKISSPHCYSTQSKLFYEGQTPIVAYLLLNGYIHLTKNNKIKGILDPGTLLGFKELMNNEAVDMDAEILPNTEVCFLDRSTILEILNHKEQDDELQEFFSSLIAV
ncbi:cyclic nucleotide-binding domain-containing protein [Halobacteriovorax sp. HLS]|uniref:cyclic nucleotide-binding domain-containing protein n=1 Tax=Halobacteriovorax sp. HLS TaxID=2234000 RepID=UPI000FDC6F9A|nr:cyclic nucleotide-binding domain-containing protein [Halobacteriovorax sp. HLS]